MATQIVEPLVTANQVKAKISKLRKVFKFRGPLLLLYQPIYLFYARRNTDPRPSSGDDFPPETLERIAEHTHLDAALVRFGAEFLDPLHRSEQVRDGFDVHRDHVRPGRHKALDEADIYGGLRWS